MPLALAAVLACSDPPRAGDEAGSRPDGRPNVLLYLVDTLRRDRVGAYGYGEPTTPTLDALAAEGIVFEQAYAPGPWTLPSVVSLMLSQPMCRHRVVVDGTSIDPRATPLAEILDRAGYATGSFIANSYAGRPSGLDRGFQVYAGPVDDPARHVGALADAAAGRPFFAYVHDVRPHDPYEAKERHLELFGEVSPQELQTIRNRSSTLRRLSRVDHAAGAPPGTTDNTRAQTRALARLDEIAKPYGRAYDARIREADEHLRDTLEELRRRGLLDDTAVLVVSDHGEELGEHGGWLHDHSVYEELVRVPLVMRLPDGRAGGRRIDAVVTLLDVAPTIADLAGVSTPEGAFEGRSLLPLVRDTGAEKPAGPVVASMRINEKKHYRPWKRSRGDRNVVVRDGPWKLIWNVEPGSAELYHLGRDPGETNDLHASEKETTARLLRFARERQAECARREATPGGPGEISPEAQERLRALGYVD